MDLGLEKKLRATVNKKISYVEIFHTESFASKGRGPAKAFASSQALQDSFDFHPVPLYATLTLLVMVEGFFPALVI